MCLNKDDTNIIEDEELFKVTPHFLNDNKISSDSVKEENVLKRPIVPNKDNTKKIKAPLTCDSNKRFVNYKFNFNFETKENGIIIPKDAKKEEKKPKKISNAFRIGNKNIDCTKNRILNINKHNYSNNKIYSRKVSQNDKLNHSPLNSSLKSLKYNNINQTSPIRPIKNKDENKYNNIRNNRKCAILDNQRKMRAPRPNSVNNISSKNKIYNHSNQTNEINKDNKDKNNISNYNQKKKYSNSVNKNVILPKLSENKNCNIKTQLKTEFTNLFKMLPDNYEDDPEIKNNLGFIFQKIYGIKEYIHKNSQSSMQLNGYFNEKNQK